MDALKYLKAKAKGQASITKPLMPNGEWDGGTIIVSVPGGYDPTTGAALPPVETGMQIADLTRDKEAAAKAITAAQDALDKAQAAHDAFDVVIADANK